MNKITAISLLVAAKEDPVLAAWASMSMTTGTETSPEGLSAYDAWEAYQGFYDMGLVSPDTLRHTDPETAFFSRRPSWGSIQGVLYAYESMKEPSAMSTDLKSTNPFGESNALINRDTSRSPVVPSSRRGSSPFTGKDELAPFQQADQISPFEARPTLRDAQSPFSLPSHGRDALGDALPCRETSSITIEGRTFAPEVSCCRTPLILENDGGNYAGSDDLPGGVVAVIDAVFYGTCPKCTRVWHISVGETIMQDGIPR